MIITPTSTVNVSLAVLIDDNSNDELTVHTNYVGAELVHGILVISILTDTEQHQGEEVYRVLVKTRERDLSLLLPRKNVKASSSKSKTNKQHVRLHYQWCDRTKLTMSFSLCSRPR